MCFRIIKTKWMFFSIFGVGDFNTVLKISFFEVQYKKENLSTECVLLTDIKKRTSRQIALLPIKECNKRFGGVKNKFLLQKSLPELVFQIYFL